MFPFYKVNGFIFRNIQVTLRSKKQLWGGEFCTHEYFVNTVSHLGNETTISKYVKEQGLEKEYKVLHKEIQLSLF